MVGCSPRDAVEEPTVAESSTEVSASIEESSSEDTSEESESYESGPFRRVDGSALKGEIEASMLAPLVGHGGGN